MIVDEADMDMEMANDPFIEAGIDVPANLPYKHNAQHERSYRKVLGSKDTPEITKKLRSLTQWTLRGTGVSTATLRRVFKAEQNVTKDVLENSNAPDHYDSTLGNRRQSSPAIYSESASEVEKTHRAEQRLKKHPFKRSNSSALFHSSYDRSIEPAVPIPKDHWKNEKIRLAQNKRAVVSNVL